MNHHQKICSKMDLFCSVFFLLFWPIFRQGTWMGPGIVLHYTYHDSKPLNAYNTACSRQKVIVWAGNRSINGIVVVQSSSTANGYCAWDSPINKSWKKKMKRNWIHKQLWDIVLIPYSRITWNVDEIWI